ncbi:hypothetical protein WKK05_01075 [Nostoc sp. UHCC 0302]|uniref:hypothetical protein n=1 Tax=Nostoc sp. UHCC 0302 TaxID=3134896 RepID=UPI00311CA4A8
MEKSQSVQYEQTQLIGATPELTNSKSKAIASSKILINLVAHHPWLLLTGLFAMCLGGATFALYSLSHVGRVAQVESEKIPAVVEEPIKTPSENINPTPLWMIAAIALSCGSGCLIIYRILNRPKPLQKVQKQINRRQARLAENRYQSPRLEPRLPQNQPVFVPQQQLMTSVMPISPKTKHLVTVLPPEHRHHLDTQKESLADLLDIRKQSSLSTILQKY